MEQPSIPHLPSIPQALSQEIIAKHLRALIVKQQKQLRKRGYNVEALLALDDEDMARAFEIVAREKGVWS